MSRSAALSLPLSCSGRKREKRTVRRIRIFLTISSGVIISYSGKFCNADLQGFMKICRPSVDGFFAINHIRRGSASLVSCKHPRLPNFCSNWETVNIFWMDHIMEKYIYNEQNKRPAACAAGRLLHFLLELPAEKEARHISAWDSGICGIASMLSRLSQ